MQKAELGNDQHLSPLLLLAGDQVGHLWWRMLNGEVPSRRHPKAVVILIGTNDLTADDCLAEEEASVIAAQGVVSRSASCHCGLEGRLAQYIGILWSLGLEVQHSYTQGSLTT